MEIGTLAARWERIPFYHIFLHLSIFLLELMRRVELVAVSGAFILPRVLFFMPMPVMNIGHVIVLMFLGGMFAKLLPKGTQNAKIGA